MGRKESICDTLVSSSGLRVADAAYHGIVPGTPAETPTASNSDVSEGD